MTESNPNHQTSFTNQTPAVNPAVVIPPGPTPGSSAALADRLRALQASRTSAGPSATTARPAVARSKKSARATGPAPARIVAAAASVAAGIGLVALMAGAQQDIVVQVNPTPVTVQPASVIVEMQPGSANGHDVAEVQVRIVEAATPAERPVPQARVVAQSEGS